MPSVPLPAVLALQILIVVAAFAAAITVLSEQQRSEFDQALEKQLTLQRASALDAVTAPLLYRKELFSTYVQQYVNGHQNDKKFVAPADEVGMTENFARLMSFYDHFYILTSRDPMIKIVGIGNESTRVYPDYAAGGAKAKTNITGAPPTIIWNMWGVDNIKIAHVQNELATACLGAYPVDPSTCFKVTQYFDTSTTFRTPSEFNHSALWGSPGMIVDTTVGGLSHVVSFLVNPNRFVRPYCVFTVSFSLSHVKPIVVGSAATETSTTAVYSHITRFETIKEYTLVSGKFSFADFDVERFEASGKDFSSSAWRGGRTPDATLNAVFLRAQSMLINTTGSAVFDIEVDGKKYVASVARKIDPQTGLDWLLTEHTLREEFYGVSDRARLIGVLIGVMGALVVLITCILIWLAIRLPLKSINAAMDLAAEMRNDEVVYVSPLLTEIKNLNNVFRQMNNKLLAARPFLPQSLLQARFGTDDDEEEDLHGLENVAVVDPCASSSDQHASPHSPYSEALSPSVDDSSRDEQPSSRRRVDDSSTQHSTSSSRHRKPGKRSGALSPLLTKELEYRRVSVLSINVLCFHRSLSAHSINHSTIIRLHSQLAKIVEQAASEERGIVDYFHGDRFVCSFNAARMCGNGVRNGAETAVKIWERFQNHQDESAAQRMSLSEVFPLGLSMGLSAGRAAVGNHGTETMQRLATIGSPYSEAVRLQDVFARNIVCKDGAVNPYLAGRCLTMGRVVQDLEISQVQCQVIGGVPAKYFLPSADVQCEKAAVAFASARNHESTDNKAALLVPDNPLTECSTAKAVLVAVISAASTRAVPAKVVENDEWLYQMNNEKHLNPFLEVNAVLKRLWADKGIAEIRVALKAKYQKDSVHTSPHGNVPNLTTTDNEVAFKWGQYVTSILETASSEENAMNLLTYV